MYLAGDVGGTKTNLAIFDAAKGPRQPLAQKKFTSAKYPSLAALIRDFLGQAHTNVVRATIGVAGPVVAGRSEITNLPWILDEDQLQEDLELEHIALINDLVATANAIPFLEPNSLHTLYSGKPEPTGTIGVIAPGTGLGESYLIWSGERYLPFASEGGHTDFGPTSPLEFGLLRYLQERFGHVSYERICSGMGLPNIYHYLKEMGFAEEPPWLTEELQTVEDITPVIARIAQDTERPCDLCRTAMETFITVLGAEAGNLALKLLATGGIYLGGGIPPRILPLLSDGLFINSLQKKGRFSDLLAKVPVHVIMDGDVALTGAAYHVFEDLNFAD
jgi:glucokinase